jgi:hypothetical protein
VIRPNGGFLTMPLFSRIFHSGAADFNQSFAIRKEIKGL